MWDLGFLQDILYERICVCAAGSYGQVGEEEGGGTAREGPIRMCIHKGNNSAGELLLSGLLIHIDK